MNTKMVVGSGIVIILIVLGVWQYQNHKQQVQTTQQSQSNSSQDNQNLKIDMYSLNGTVTSISGKQITFRTGTVQTTAAGSQFVYATKTVDVTSDTKFAKPDPKAKVTLADIVIGSNITVYTTKNPNASDEFSADKILINK